MNRIIGILIITTSTTLYALLYPLIKKASQQLPPFTIMAISMIVLFSLSLIAAVFLKETVSVKTDVLKANLLTLIAIGFINFIAFWLLILSYKYFPVWQATMFSLLTPVLAGIFAYFILGEKLSINLFWGLILIGLGLFIAVR